MTRVKHIQGRIHFGVASVEGNPSKRWPNPPKKPANLRAHKKSAPSQGDDSPPEPEFKPRRTFRRISAGRDCIPLSLGGEGVGAGFPRLLSCGLAGPSFMRWAVVSKYTPGLVFFATSPKTLS